MKIHVWNKRMTLSFALPPPPYVGLIFISIREPFLLRKITLLVMNRWGLWKRLVPK
ncbi:hypothetical protein D3C75_1287650 [compost metagenome]